MLAVFTIFHVFRIAILFCGLIKTWNVSVWYSFLLPIYGATCVILAKICGKQIRRIRKKYKFGKIITYTAVLLFFVALKSISVSWECSKRNSFEKEDILARKDYLLGKLMVNPQVVLNEMPAAIGTQFQGEMGIVFLFHVVCGIGKHIPIISRDKNREHSTH